MRDLVALVARGLVREPGRVRVEERSGPDRSILELSVAPGDRGRVLGREGRTAAAMRTLVEVLSSRRGRPCSLEVLD